MSNHAHDYDQVVALLKSVATPCEAAKGKDADHAWRKCRHCLAVMELDHRDVRVKVRAFIRAVEAMDANYGKGDADARPELTIDSLHRGELADARPEK